jgi:hypothetical protein
MNRKLLSTLDTDLSLLSESAARKLNRREVMTHSLKGVVATVAGISVGALIRPSDALADDCQCGWPGGPPGQTCGSIGYTCPSWGCPSGCQTCIQGDCDDCGYPSGWWTSCSCGLCNIGFRACFDCVCTGCGYGECGCLSGCQCFSCCNRAELVAKLQELTQLAESA